MFLASDNSSTAKSHFGLIAAVMLVVVLLSTGAAWLLVARRGQSAEAGAAIVQTIRERTLASFWPRPQVQWYLMSKDEQPFGWHLWIVRPAGDLYHGLEITYVHTQAGTRIVWERWQLTHDISAGAYRAGTFRPDTQSQIADTVINYKDGQVAVQQTEGQAYAQSPAPPNYLPEGTLHLACLLAATQGSKAYFRLVYNESATEGDKVDFTPISVKPADIRPYRIQGAQAGVTLRAWVGQRRDQVLLFDKSDQLIATIPSGEGVLQMAATQQQVVRSFPGADQIAAYLSHVLKLPLNPGEAPRPPRIEPQPEMDAEETALEGR